MTDRIIPTVADGAPIVGELVAVIDESSQTNTAGGITYVVAVAALFDPTRARAELGRLFTADRRRAFHWEREGAVARTRIIDIAAEIGVVATAHYSHVGRRGQAQARRSMLTLIAVDIANDDVDHLLIEASDAATIGRDQRVLLDTFRETGGVPFAYDWRSKAEPLLWVADAIAGAVGEYVVGEDSSWYEMLSDCGIVSLRTHPRTCESPGSRPRRPFRTLGPALRGSRLPLRTVRSDMTSIGATRRRINPVRPANSQVDRAGPTA